MHHIGNGDLWSIQNLEHGVKEQMSEWKCVLDKGIWWDDQVNMDVYTHPNNKIPIRPFTKIFLPYRY